MGIFFDVKKYAVAQKRLENTALEPNEDSEEVAALNQFVLCHRIVLTLFCLVSFSFSDLDSDNMEMDYGKTSSISR